MAAITLTIGFGLLPTVAPAQAADWLVKAQANGGAIDSGYGYCGSSDGNTNCASVTGNASGSVTYSNGGTTITAAGEAQSQSNAAAFAGGTATADLATATIRQINSSAFGSAGTAGTLIDQLTFILPDPTQVYAIAFNYSFDGGLSGDIVGDYHPGLGAYSTLALGYSSIGSSQSIGESGPAYFPPMIGGSNGSGEWTNVIVTPGMYGYSVSGNVLIGGQWGDTMTFNMQSSISCANEYGSADCDYSHTQLFDFGVLPDGVSFTSASSVFLTGNQAAGVPEPASWALLIVGFGAIGGAMRRAKRTSPVIMHA